MGEAAHLLNVDSQFEYDTEYGIGFSGGGIRSASFCSGVLRQLVLDAKKKGTKLPKYISCVSGGGYIGAGFTNWVHSNPESPMEEYFTYVREGIGYYLNWRNPWIGLLDTAVVVIFLITLIFLSLIVLVPSTYIFTEFYLWSYEWYFNLDIPRWAKVGALWGLVIYALSGAWVQLLGWFTNMTKFYTLQNCFINANFFLTATFMLIAFVVLFDFSEREQHDVTTVETVNVYFLRSLLLLCCFYVSPGTAALFLQAQLVIWAVSLNDPVHNVLGSPADVNFAAHYRYYAIISKILLPFMGFIAHRRDRLVFEFSRWRIERCFFNVASSSSSTTTKPKSFRDRFRPRVKKMHEISQQQKGPVYIGQCTVNKWVVPHTYNEIGYLAKSYGILAITSEKNMWERYETGLRKPIQIKVCLCKGYCVCNTQDPEVLIGARDLSLSEVMAMSAAAGSFFNGDMGGLQGASLKTQALFGLHMGKWINMGKLTFMHIIVCLIIECLLAWPVIVWGLHTDPICRSAGVAGIFDQNPRLIELRCGGGILVDDVGALPEGANPYLGGVISMFLYFCWVAILPCLPREHEQSRDLDHKQMATVRCRSSAIQRASTHHTQFRTSETELARMSTRLTHLSEPNAPLTLAPGTSLLEHEHSTETVREQKHSLLNPLAAPFSPPMNNNSDNSVALHLGSAVGPSFPNGNLTREQMYVNIPPDGVVIHTDDSLNRGAQIEPRNVVLDATDTTTYPSLASPFASIKRESEVKARPPIKLPLKTKLRNFLRAIYPYLPHVFFLSTLLSLHEHTDTLPSMLYMSDGGHIENMAMLPLLSRRLKKIVIVNGGEDPKNKDFKKAIDQARDKLGVTVYADVINNVNEAIDQFTEDDSRHVLALKVLYGNKSVGTWWHRATDLPDKENKEAMLYFVKPTALHYEDTTPGGKDKQQQELELRRRGKFKYFCRCRKRRDTLPRGEDEFEPARRHLAGCCCWCCHLCDCWYAISGWFPFHHTAFQCFTMDQFDSYHSQGVYAMRAVQEEMVREPIAPFSKDILDGWLLKYYGVNSGLPPRRTH